VRSTFRIRGYHPILLAFPDHSTMYHATTLRSRNPNQQADWFGLFRFRSPLLTESRLISLPQGTEMFHFPWSHSEALCIQTPVTRHYPGWVAPFGNLRINVCLPLPEAYRSLPRPSSSSGAKASAVCSYTLTETLALNARRSSAFTDYTTNTREVALYNSIFNFQRSNEPNPLIYTTS
jgi:hypothetical protein